MKASFPLSLKVTLWLVLNLLLLAAIGLGVLVARGGIGWDSLARGPAGHRIQEIGQALAAEVAADNEDRAALIARFNLIYGAEFFVFSPAFGAPEQRALVPPEILAHIAEGPPGRRGSRPGNFRPPEPGEPGRPPPAPRLEDQARGRFLIRAGNPAAYWLGVRVIPPRRTDSPAGRGPFLTVVARVDSWWGLLRLLDLQPWLMAAGTVFVFSMLFWLPFVRSITRDLRRLASATEKIAEGKFETRVTVDRRDEIGGLGESVNLMASRLDNLVHGQKRFLGDVAHELGSPLGRLQLAVEILEARADPSLRSSISDVREEVQQMTTLVNELLAFTKAGLRPRAAELGVVSLADVVRDVLAREDGGARVRCDVPSSLHVLADRELLARALGNLVRNALRYSGPEAPIAIGAHAENARVLLAVEDEGPGVPPDALARLGEPFYRPESARTRETGGVGLGLAIVRGSVAACGGEVQFSNRTPRGFRAELRLTPA